MKTLKFSVNVLIICVVICQVQGDVIDSRPWYKKKHTATDVTAHKDPMNVPSQGTHQGLHLKNAAKTESLKLLRRLKKIDKKAELVHQKLQKFQHDVTSLRLKDKISAPLHKRVFAQIVTLKRVLQEGVLGYVDPFRPLTKIPPEGYYLDDVTDVDNAEYELKKILAALMQISREVKQVLREAENRENRVEDTARIFQWAVRLSLEAKQVHLSITNLKQLIREHVEEEKMDVSEAKKLSAKILEADDRLMKDVELPLHHFEPLDKPPTIGYPKDTEEVLTGVQDTLLSIKQDLVQIGDTALRVVYDTKNSQSQGDGFKDNKSGGRPKRETEMEGTLIQLGDPALRKLRDSDDKAKEEAETNRASWKVIAAVGGLLALFGILLGATFATICYLYSKEFRRDPYRCKRSHQKIATSEETVKEEKTP